MGNTIQNLWCNYRVRQDSSRMTELVCNGLREAYYRSKRHAPIRAHTAGLRSGSCFASRIGWLQYHKCHDSSSSQGHWKKRLEKGYYRHKTRCGTSSWSHTPPTIWLLKGTVILHSMNLTNTDRSIVFWQALYKNFGLLARLWQMSVEGSFTNRLPTSISCRLREFE